MEGIVLHKESEKHVNPPSLTEIISSTSIDLKESEDYNSLKAGRYHKIPHRGCHET